MSSARATLRAELEKDVALMRKLGVARWGDIVVGPPPVEAASAKELTPEEMREALEKAAQKHFDVMFASTSIRPSVRGMRKVG